MGYGVPAAVAAKLLHPDRTVVCIAGDGCFLMTGRSSRPPCSTALASSSSSSTTACTEPSACTRSGDYPGRVVATDLRNPDFVALAKAYGAFGEAVERTEDFPPAFERAHRSGRPALLHLKLDPEAITPTQSLTQIRDAALAKR